VIPAVFDCNILISALGWGGLPRVCLDLVFGGTVLLCVTPAVWAEYDSRVPEVLAAKQPAADPRPALAALLRRVHFVEAAALGKRRSRDVKDDPYLAAALGARAEYLVTNDRDLLALGKPFGVAILTPAQFIKRVRPPGQL
jgi:putative PIN family toxin of toxin-antitoxin system